jgi:PAS domain S-box-containing protein
MQYAFKDLIDVDKLQELTDELYEAASIPSSIITMDGEILTGSGWQEICTEFHRKHPLIEQECVESDTKIRKKLDLGEPFVIYQCPRGLVDASSPIVIAGKHVANVFSGQVFLKPPDQETEKFFREQARKYNFDETAYMRAFRNIPVFTEKRFRSGLSFLAKLARLIAEMGLRRLNELEAVDCLRESEGKFRSLFENINVGVALHEIITDEDNNAVDFVFLDANPKYEEITGLKASKIIGKRGLEVIPILEKKWIDAYGRVALTGRSTTIIDHSDYLDGYLEVKAYSPKANQFGVAMTDITMRKQAEDALRESEERYRLLFDNADALVSVYDRNGVCLLMNRKTARLFGGEPADFIGKSLAELHPGAAAEYTERIRHAIDRETSAEYEDEVPFPEGSRRLLSTVHPVRNASGSIYAAQIISQDITMRKRAEEELRISRERFELAMRFSNDGLFDWDLETDRVYYSSGWKRMLGYAEHEIENEFSEWERLTKPQDVRDSWAMMKEVMEKKRGRFEKEFQMRHKNGRWVDVLSRANVVFDDAGKPVRVVGTHVDITERKRAEKALQWNARRNELLSDAAARLLRGGASNELVQFLCRSVMGFLDCQVFFNFLVDRESDRLRLNAYAGIPEDQAEKIRWLDFSASVCGCTARDHRRMIFEDIFNSSEPEIELVKSYGIQTCCCHPLMIEDRLVGTLSFGTRSRPRFESEEIELMEAVSHLAAIALNRIETEEALRRREEKYRGIFNDSITSVYLFDEAKHFIDSNQAGIDLLGYSKEELLHMSIPDVDADPVAVLPAHERLLGGDRLVNYEHRLKRKDGEIITVLNNSIPITDAEGRVVGMQSTLVDITQRKQAEKEREELQLRLSNAMEMAKLGHWEYDIDNDLFTFNDHFYKLFGTTAEEVGGYTMASREYARRFIHPEDQNVVAEETRKAIETDDPNYAGQLEHRMLYADGRAGHVAVRFSVVKNEQGRTIRTIGVNQDITNQKQNEERIAQLQKMESIGRLAGGVAHDFNNMLGVILGHTEMALDQVNSEEPVYADLKEIHKAAGRSADLTRQLLAFARKQTINPKILDLNAVVEGMLKMLRRLIGEDIDLVWRPGKVLWRVKMDPTQVDQILANLCVNARDAVEKQGRVTIETRNVSFDSLHRASRHRFLPGDFVLLAVSDNGCGMDEETLANLFEPFFTTKGTGKGTGLGLATIYGIVRQNNGFIDVQSEPGKGTRFSVHLPKHTDRIERAQGRDSAASPEVGDETVLLVEDETAMLKMTQAMLERLGYRVLACQTPGEALRLAEEFTGRLDLLMTDVVMPGMNGRELAKLLQELRPNLQVLFASGYTADVIAQHGILSEDVHFIQKPFTLGGLSHKVREILGESRKNENPRQ